MYSFRQLRPRNLEILKKKVKETVQPIPIFDHVALVQRVLDAQRILKHNLE
jgi:hypothetical protein